MTDISTNRPMRLSTDGTAGPYLMVPLEQLKEVLSALDAQKVPYWVDEGAISLGDRPYIAVVNFGRTGDAEHIQAILDGIV